MVNIDGKRIFLFSRIFIMSVEIIRLLRLHQFNTDKFIIRRINILNNIIQLYLEKCLRKQYLLIGDLVFI